MYKDLSIHKAQTFFKILWQDIDRCNLFHYAYSMAYVSLLSLIPSLSAIFAVLTLFSPLLEQDSEVISDLRRFLLEHLAAGSGEQVISYIEGFISNLDIKKIGLTGFAGTLVTLILLLKQIELALNHIFQIKKTRNLVSRFVNFWTFFTLGAFSLALFIGTISNVQSEGLNQIWTTVSTWSNKVIMILLFSLIYKLIPNCNVKTSSALLGGFFATCLLTLAGKVFQAYIVLFSNYEAIYGAALAAIPTFLLWLYVIWIIVLLGAIVTWRTQQGFHLNKRENKTQIYPLSIANELKFYLLPAVLIKCYESYQQGTGKGVSGESLARDMELPLFWIDESLAFLESQDFIIREESNGTYFIKYPPEKVFMKTIKSKLGLDETSLTSDEFLRLKLIIENMAADQNLSIKSSIDQAE